MANTPSLYCFPFTDDCRLMAEWGVWWQAFGILITLLVGIVGVVKIFHELKRLEEQRRHENEAKESSAQLKRIEYFLDQHRRLFDDKDLYEVLSLIDGDSPDLRPEPMWDKKRKFLTFLEEIALLVRAGQINPPVAYYMFGYYARQARDGSNFNVGIDISPEHWGLFYWFTDQATEFKAKYPNGPTDDLNLVP